MIDFSLHNGRFISLNLANSAGYGAKFNELVEKIKNCTGIVVKNKINVGCFLYQMWESCCYVAEFKTVRDDYQLSGYSFRNCHQDVFYAVCDKFFSLDKKEVQTYMNVASCFVDPEKFELYPKYKDFKWYQLVEMIPLSEEQREKIDPSWSRQRIRDYKKSLKPPKEETLGDICEGLTELIHTEATPEEPEADPEDVDDEMYVRELRNRSFDDAISEAVKYRRQTFELQEQIIKLEGDLEYFRDIAISKVTKEE